MRALGARAFDLRWSLGLPRAALGRLRPYTFHLAFAVFLPLLLALDAAGASTRQQYALGLLTLAFLIVAARFSPPAERRQVWLVVVLWGLIELFASLVWGIYVYRLD